MTRIMISAGELSGDEHGANLLQEIKRIYPRGEFYGMGGKNLKAAGLEAIVDAERAASVMGASEVFSGLRSIFASWKTMTGLFVTRRPDVLVIINYSEFNLRLAKVAKKYGIKVLFYIPPQVWAWRAGRVREIDRVCDIVATIFPFEKEFYVSRGCHRVTFVGHPFTTTFESERLAPGEKAEIIQSLGLSRDKPIVLLFPGSRRKEILAHLDFVFDAFKILTEKNPLVQGLLVSASADWVEEFKTKIPPGLNITVTTGNSLKLLQIGDVGLIKSGTSNLQAVFARLPFVMFYRPAALTGLIIRCLVHGIRQFSIVNILRPNTVPEVVGEQLNPAEAGTALDNVLFEGAARRSMLNAFSEIEANLSGADQLPIFTDCHSASQRTARLVESLVDVQR